jgi:hypothetical protein
MLGLRLSESGRVFIRPKCRRSCETRCKTAGMSRQVRQCIALGGVCKGVRSTVVLEVIVPGPCLCITLPHVLGWFPVTPLFIENPAQLIHTHLPCTMFMCRDEMRAQGIHKAETVCAQVPSTGNTSRRRPGAGGQVRMEARFPAGRIDKWNAVYPELALLRPRCLQHGRTDMLGIFKSLSLVIKQRVMSCERVLSSSRESVLPLV